MREVIDAAERVSGARVKVQRGPAPRRRSGRTHRRRRAGAQTLFGWSPRFDDLETIIRHALHWEERCAAKRALIRAGTDRPALFGKEPKPVIPAVAARQVSKPSGVRPN